MLDGKMRAIIEVVAKALDVSPDELGPDTSMDNTPLWDSVAHMSICLEFERRFGKPLDFDQIYTVCSVRDLVPLVP